MGAHHDKLLEAAKATADVLHRDTSVSMQTTLEDLGDLRDYVEELMDVVEMTMPDEEEE